MAMVVFSDYGRSGFFFLLILKKGKVNGQALRSRGEWQHSQSQYSEPEAQGPDGPGRVPSGKEPRARWHT